MVFVHHSYSFHLRHKSRNLHFILNGEILIRTHPTVMGNYKYEILKNIHIMPDTTSADFLWTCTHIHDFYKYYNYHNYYNHFYIS